MRRFFYLLFLALPFCGSAQGHVYVSIETDYGTMVVRLANETPHHRDNFTKLVRRHYFDTTLFHRVIPRFVIQGGDPDSLFPTITDTVALKSRRLAAEFNPALFHKRGALGMGSDENPLKASFFTQFYVVQGRTYTDAGLDSLEQGRMKGQKISPGRRQVYKTIGGLPWLDDRYTIFGEVVQGLEVVDAIAGVKTTRDQPVQPVRMKLRLLPKREARKLERRMRKMNIDVAGH